MADVLYESDCRAESTLVDVNAKSIKYSLFWLLLLTCWRIVWSVVVLLWKGCFEFVLRSFAICLIKSTKKCCCKESCERFLARMCLILVWLMRFFGKKTKNNWVKRSKCNLIRMSWKVCFADFGYRYLMMTKFFVDIVLLVKLWMAC